MTTNQTIDGVPRGPFRILKVWWLKRKARKTYICFKNACDRLGCGNEIAAYVSRDVRESRETFNRCMDKLAALGEKVPEKRL